MAPGEDDTWHARCHTHRLLGGGHVRRVIQPPPIKFAIEKKNKGNKKKSMERIKKKKRKERERRLCVREREPRGRESEKGRKLVDQFVGGRKEKKRKKERKGKEKRKKKKRRERKPDQRRAVVGLGDAWNRTVLREVGVFLPPFYSTPRGRVMAYKFCLIFGQICMMCGLFVIVGRSWTEYMSSWDHRGRAQRLETELIWAEWKTGACPTFRTPLRIGCVNFRQSEL